MNQHGHSKIEYSYIEYRSKKRDKSRRYKHTTRAGRDPPLLYVLLLPLGYQIIGKPGSIEGTPARGHIIGVGDGVGTTVKTQLIVV